MNKKYVYEFVNETVEIEISEEWEAVLKEIDREEYNIDHRETRRHEGLDIGMEGGDWLLDRYRNPEDIFVDEDAKALLIRKAAKILTPKQLDAFEKVCIMRYTEAEYGNLMGISQPTVHEHVARAKAKMVKFHKVQKDN